MDLRDALTRTLAVAQEADYLHKAKGDDEAMDVVREFIKQFPAGTLLQSVIAVMDVNNKVFNVPNLCEELQSNLMCAIGDHCLMNKEQWDLMVAQVCQTVLDTIKPPSERTHTGPDGTVFYVKRNGYTQWLVFKKDDDQFDWFKVETEKYDEEEKAVEAAMKWIQESIAESKWN